MRVCKREWGTLDYGSDDIAECTKHDGAFPTKLVAYPDTTQWAEETAQSVDRNDSALRNMLWCFELGIWI